MPHNERYGTAAVGANRSFGDRCLNWVNFGALRETGPCDRTAYCVPDPMSVMRPLGKHMLSTVLVSVLTRNGRGICKGMDAVQSHVLGVMCSDSNGDERK